MEVTDFNLAAIDVGSNAARLLIKHADIDDTGKATLTKLLFLRVPLRLGMDVFADGKISRERRKELVATMKAYHELMKAYSVSRYRACATSAMRDASNGKRIMQLVRQKAKVNLEIISGGEESRIIYDNHLSNLPAKGCFLYVDVGGGSTEVSFICDGRQVYSNSFNVGTIRLLKKKVRLEDIEALKDDIAKITLGRSGIVIVGSGGNINKLYRLASKKEKLPNGTLPVDCLEKEYNELGSMSVEQRMAVYNLKPDRADVIVPAAEIFLHIAASANAGTIIVPNVGLADGIINEMLSVENVTSL